ncbi:MAG: LamG-like jellyroll fold domain-containing protein, partial [Gammaproteobacteria bacterium]
MDIAELMFSGGVFAAAELNLGVARAGVAGGIFITVDFDLHDPDKDGKLRLVELFNNVRNEFVFGSPALAPIAIFDVSGEIFARLFAFLKIDLFLFSIDKEFDITPPITLVEFEIPFTRIPTLAQETAGGSLQLNMGPAARDRLEGDIRDIGETFTVTQGASAGEVLVSSAQFSDPSDQQSYDVSNTIIIVGGAGDDVIDLSGITNPDIAYDIDLGEGNNTVILAPTAGRAVIRGGGGDDDITTGAGNDVIIGGGGADTIRAGAGNDIVFADNGEIAQDAYVGKGRLTDAGDTVFGGEGNDLLFGGGGNDVIAGDVDSTDPGADENSAPAGDDIIVGDGATIGFGSSDPNAFDAAAIATGDIADTDRGSGGNDTLIGHLGADRIFAGKGDDLAIGGSGADFIAGDQGMDTLRGGVGGDTISGGSEDDSITGGEGVDDIDGGAGMDTIEGNAGNDLLSGGAGNDLILGQQGDDTLFGGSDSDTLVGGGGADTIDGAGGANVIWGDDRPDDHDTGAQGADVITAGVGPDEVHGQGGDDDIDVMDGDNLVFGDGGSDTIVGGAGNHIVFGGAGSDDITLGDAVARVGFTGRVGSEVLGGAGVDTVIVGDGDHLIRLEQGDDSLVAGVGNSDISGGGGSDQITVAGGTNLIYGDDNVEEIPAGSTGPEAADTIFGGTGDDEIHGQGGDDVIDARAGDDDIFSGLGNDTITAGLGSDDVIAGPDTINALEGETDDDIVYGGTGPDGDAGEIGSSNTLILGAGDDMAWGDFGQDLIQGDLGADEIRGLAGNDDIQGNADDDTIFGGEGDDVIVGGRGDDEVHAGAGRDIVWGGFEDVFGVVAGGAFEASRNAFAPDNLENPAGFDAAEARIPTGYTPPRLAPKFALGLSVGSDSDLDPGTADELGNPQDFNDLLHGDEDTDFIFGGGGRDMLFGGGGSDYLDGGVERDEVYGEGGDDVVRGGANDDVVHGDYKYDAGSTFAVGGLVGDEGIDQVYGDGGTDFLFGDAGRFDPVSGEFEQRGQRLWGGDGIDFLYAFANVGVTADPADIEAETQAFGDELHGGAGRDWLYGNLRRDVIFGDSGAEFIASDALAGPTLAVNAFSRTIGGDDIVFGGTGQDQIQGGGGNDELWGGGDGDWLEGEKGDDVLFGGSGIDFMVLDVRGEYFDEGAPAPEDRFDGHFGNEFENDITDDNATDIMLVEGTNQDDTLLIGQLADGRMHVNYRTVNPVTGELEEREILAPWRQRNADGTLDPSGTPLVEQFRISGLSGDDYIEFIDASYLAFGRDIDPLDVSDLIARSDDNVGVIDTGPGDDVALGTEANDRIDGMSGSDTLFGRAGNDTLWGDSTAGEEAASTNTLDVIFGGRGNDDLIGGPGINDLYAWSQRPLPAGDTEFGVFVNPDDPQGPLFDDSGDADGDGLLDEDGVSPARILEDTGLDRMLGGRNADRPFAGTGLSFLFGNGGDDQLFRVDGSLFETLDGGLDVEAWKQFAQDSGRVIYVAASEADDVITVDFVNEPGPLAGRHLITRLTNNNGVFTFAAQDEFEFIIGEGGSDPASDDLDVITRIDDLQRRGSQQQDVLEPDVAIQTPGTEAEAVGIMEGAALEGLVPTGEGIEAILIDALGGDDLVTVGPTVQHSVWIDGGAGDDVVKIEGGDVILSDQTELLSPSNPTPAADDDARNDSPQSAFYLSQDPFANFPDNEAPLSASTSFIGLNIDNPDDEDWYRFSVADSDADGSVGDGARLGLSSGSENDGLAVALFETDATTVLGEGALQLGRDLTDLGATPANDITNAFELPDIQSLGRASGLSIHDAGDVDVFSFELDRPGAGGDRINLLKAGVEDELDIELLDSAGTVLVTGVETAPLVDAVSLEGLAPGDYFIRVGTDSTLARYDLIFQVPGLRESESSITSQTNVTDSTALDLGAHSNFPTVLGTSVALGEEQWYVFDLLREGSVADEVAIKSDAFVQLRLYQRNDDGVPVELAAVDSNEDMPGTISLASLAAGEYLLQVSGATESQPPVNYELRPGDRVTERDIVEGVDGAGELARTEIRTVREPGQTVVDLAGAQTTFVDLSGLSTGTDYLVRVTSPNRVPTVYDLNFDLNRADTEADLSVEKTLVSGDPAPADGETVTIEIEVTNEGEAEALNVSLTDLLPAGLTPTANNATVSQGIYDTNTGAWQVGLLFSGASATLTLEGTVDAGQGGATIALDPVVPTGTVVPESVVQFEVDLAIKANTERRDVIVGGTGNDALQGGPGPTWIFGLEGNDVLSGGFDRQSPDLLFGGAGDDAFQLLPDRLPFIKGTTETFLPTLVDRFDGGPGEDEVLFLGGDLDALNRPVPDWVAIRWDRFQQRYEFTAVPFDTANQVFAVDQETVNATRPAPLDGFMGTVNFRLQVPAPGTPGQGLVAVSVDIEAGNITELAEQLQTALIDTFGVDENANPAVVVEFPDGILRLRAQGQGLELRAEADDLMVSALGFEPLSAGSPIFLQHYAFYQALSVEKTVIDTRAGDDIVHADPEYFFPNVPTTEWGLAEGAFEEGAKIPLEIRLGDGNDRAFGSAQDDVIFGGTGADIIFGFPGNDSLFGGPGRDFIVGNRALVPDELELVTRTGSLDRNDLVGLAAELPAVRSGTTIDGLNIDLDDNGDWYIISAAEAEQRFGGATGALLTSEMIEVIEVVENEGGTVPTGENLRAFLFAAENVAGAGEPMDLVPRERFSGVPEFYLLHVTTELDANEDEPGRAVALDGVDDRIEVAADSALDILRTLTVELWFKVDGDSDTLDFGGAAWVPLLHKGGGSAANRNYSLWLNADGRVLFDSDGNNDVESQINLIRPNEWYHVAGVMDRDQGEMKLYVNGELVATEAIGTASAGGAGTSLFLGDTHGSDDPGAGTSTRFDGSIDEVRIWNQVRTDAQIAQSHLRTVPADADGLVAYWRFTEPEGATFNNTADLTDNQIDELQGQLALNLVPGAPDGDNIESSVAHVDGRALILPFGPGLYQIQFVGSLGETLHVSGAEADQTFSAVSLAGQPVVMPLGDIDGDGFDDAVVSIRDGVPGSAGGFRHFARVAFGTADGLDPDKFGLPISFELPAPVLSGDPARRATLTGVGDVDNDGIDDFAVSVPSGIAGQSKVYLIFGREDWATPNLEQEQDAGLFGEYFFLDRAVTDFPDFDDIESSLERVDSQINFPVTGGTFPGVADADTFAVRWTGQIDVTTPGLQRFFLGSDDGSRLFIDNQLVVDNRGLHPFVEQSGTVELSAGLHDIRVEFFENFGAAGVQLSWDPPGAVGKQLVPNDVLFRDARDVFRVVTDSNVILDGFTGEVRAIGAGDVTPVIGQGLDAQIFDLAGSESNELITFDGVDDRITIESRESLNPTRALTIETRFEVDGFSNQFMPLVQKNDGSATGRSYGLWILDDGAIRLGSSDGTEVGALLDTDGGLVQPGVWYELAATIDRDAGVQAIFLDGVEVASGEIATTDLLTHDSPLLFGDWLEDISTVSPFQGQLEEVALWRTIRSAEEIASDFEAIDATAPELAGYWRFDGTGDTVVDASANENDGVLGAGDADDARKPARAAVIREFPDFNELTPVLELDDDAIDYGLVAENFAGSELDQFFGVRWTGNILVETAGETRFALANDDRARLFIDDAETPLIDFYTPGALGFSAEASIDLSAGLHSVRVEYVASEAPSSILVLWDPQGDDDNVIELLAPEDFVRVDDTFAEPTAQGTDDLLIGDASGVRVVHGRATDLWGEALTVVDVVDAFATGSTFARLGDVDRDGRGDVAIVDGTTLTVSSGGGLVPDQLMIRSTITALPVGSVVHGAGDVDGDAAADILVSGENGSYLIFGGENSGVLDDGDDENDTDLVGQGFAIRLAEGAWRPIGDFDGPDDDANSFADLGAAVLVDTDRLNETGRAEHQAVRVYLGGARETLAGAFDAPDLVFEPGRASFTDPGTSTADSTFFGSLGVRTGTDGEARDLLAVTGPAGDALRLYDGGKLQPAEVSDATPGLAETPELFQFELANPTAPGFIPGPPPGVDLANDAEPSLRDAFALEGAIENERLQGAVSLADFNGDGFNDLLVYGDNGSYVLLGPVELDDVADVVETADIIISADVGRPASSMGDVTGDGLDDLVFLKPTDGDDFELIIVAGGNGGGIELPRVIDHAWVSA